MGTFHDGMGELHGMTVVVRCEGPKVVVGRYHEADERRVLLHDADVHEEEATISEFLEKAEAVGVWPKHPRLAVPTADVKSIRRLG